MVSASRANAEVKFLQLLEFLSRIPQEGLYSEFLEIVILIVLLSGPMKEKKITSKHKHCDIVSIQFQATTIKMKPIFPTDFGSQMSYTNYPKAIP